MINLSDAGTGNLILCSVYRAVYEDDKEFFESSLGSNMMSVLESKTGITYNKIKSLVDVNKKEKIQFIKQEDIENLTINELANKYNTTAGRVRYYLRCNNKQFKRIYKVALS